MERVVKCIWVSPKEERLQNDHKNTDDECNLVVKSGKWGAMQIFGEDRFLLSVFIFYFLSFFVDILNAYCVTSQFFQSFSCSISQLCCEVVGKCNDVVKLVKLQLA